MSTKPILFIGWLDLDEKNYLDGVLAKLTDVEKNVITSKFAGPGAEGEDAVRKEILDWDSTNAQILFVLTHGNTGGLGPRNDKGVAWQELWGWLQETKLDKIDLWLGACESASCASAFSHLVDKIAGKSPVRTVIGFEDKPDADEVAKLVKALVQPIIAFGNVGSSVGQALDTAKAVIPRRNPVAFVHDATANGYNFVKQ